MEKNKERNTMDKKTLDNFLKPENRLIGIIIAFVSLFLPWVNFSGNSMNAFSLYEEVGNKSEPVFLALLLGIIFILLYVKIKKHVKIKEIAILLLSLFSSIDGISLIFNEEVTVSIGAYTYSLGAIFIVACTVKLLLPRKK
jgi:phosphoglycerol transferase MdoB-like AlkP superfamily enzyme